MPYSGEIWQTPRQDRYEEICHTVGRYDRHRGITDMRRYDKAHLPIWTSPAYCCLCRNPIKRIKSAGEDWVKCRERAPWDGIFKWCPLRRYSQTMVECRTNLLLWLGWAKLKYLPCHGWKSGVITHNQDVLSKYHLRTAGMGRGGRVRREAV